MQAGVTPWVELKISNGHIMLPTQINGIDGYSIIDTGAQISGINKRFINRNNLELDPGGSMKIKGVHGTATRKVYRNVPVHLMGADLTFKSVVETNLRKDTQLLIGAGFLRQFIFQFDYPNKRMRAITRDTFDLKKLKNVESRRDKVTGVPIVKVRLNDEVDVWLITDTGNSGGVFLKRSIATRRNWLEEFEVTTITGRGVNKSGTLGVFRIPLIAIGPYDVKHARVSVPAKGKRLDMFNQQRTMGGKRSKAQGLLGYDIFKNFLVTVDYTSGAMHIEIPTIEE